MNKLDKLKWKAFRLEDLFVCSTGKYYDKKLYKNGEIPLITAKTTNNGISDWLTISEKDEFFENAITIGKVDASAFYQPYKFICSSDVNVIQLKNAKLNKYIAMFVCNQINMQSSKFSYGNQIRLNDTKVLKILLPINEKNQPDFHLMEKYIKPKYDTKVLDFKKNQTNSVQDDRELNEVHWSPFEITEIFQSIKRGKRLIKKNQIKGLVPYVSSSALNNGIDNFIANDNNVRIFENCITIANSGSVGKTFYQPYKFVASDHVTHLKKEKSNKYIYLFLTCMLNQLKDKYSFNREISDFRIKREKILLPTLNDKPDYEFMEQYMKRKENEILDRL
ncbi:restriction endonuclease subunit S [Staphylococcus hominis]|uniref:restriction endonuclease subunit S n=1 Tax=Staphylococcus hominis TaxID=1290 RepID=UPI0028752A49|nr:restriction endonuclease subunit S [Staphylococcus hominis]MDS0981524.1 restriction endonuclease subunit S [Staphylococcus hominis]